MLRVVADKVGRDVGELCGIDPLGVTATDDVDALLALQPDCVVYNPKWPDVDELVRILDAGHQRRERRPRSSPGTRSATGARPADRRVRAWPAFDLRVAA